MEDYYRARASEYEQVYFRDDPDRNAEQELVSARVKSFLDGRDVLEVACGTGYWTERLSATSKSITATDTVKEVVEIARRKKYNCPVSFMIRDAYGLGFNGQFDGGLAMFWFSHVPKGRGRKHIQA